MNQGTVAPGGSIGTLRVLGDYEHAATGTLEIETAITGESDVLQISIRDRSRARSPCAARQPSR